MSEYTEALERMVVEGDALVKAGRFAEGEARAREVLARQPRNGGGHYVLALSALMQQRHAESLEHLGSALRNDKANHYYHFMSGLSFAALGRGEDAMGSYRRSLQYRPDFYPARANLGYVLEQAGRMADAAECYRQVLVQVPDEAYCLARLGYCERMLDRPEQAIEVLRRAVALQPQAAAAHNEIALSLLRLGRTAEAIASLRAAVDAQPGFAEGWANLAKVLYVDYLDGQQRAREPGAPSASDAQAVLECFDKLLEFDPSNAEFKYLRDSLAGVAIARPPDSYIESFFDRFAPQFEARLVGELRYSAPEAMAAFLAPWIEGRKALRAVDLGCGTGLAAAFLRAHAAMLVGVDLSGQMLERARARGFYDELVREEIGDYLGRVPPGSVDLALALDVFIYVGDLARILGRAASALAPGGRLVFSIETLDGDGCYRLLPAGRYAHAPADVEATAASAGLRLAGCEDFVIRHEAGQGVPARLYAFERP